MTDEKKKHTLAGYVVAAPFAFLVAVVLAVLASPLLLAVSWARWLMWGWFAPLVGLPRVGYWTVVLAGLLFATFASARPKYKGLEYEDGWFMRAYIEVVGDGVLLALAAMVHFWVLR